MDLTTLINIMKGNNSDAVNCRHITININTANTGIITPGDHKFFTLPKGWAIKEITTILKGNYAGSNATITYKVNNVVIGGTATALSTFASSKMKTVATPFFSENGNNDISLTTAIADITELNAIIILEVYPIDTLV